MEEIVIIILLICLGLILGLFAFLFGLKITSRQKRTYLTIESTEEVLGQQVLSILEKYKPNFYQKKEIKKKIQFLFFELIEQNDKLVLIYRPVWDDEIHPNFFVNFIYKCFRWFYYNSVKDIEFIEIFVDKKTGEILSFSFETLTEGSSLQAPKHEFTTIVKKGNSYINKTNDNKLVEVKFENSHLIFQVLTWNHLLAIPEDFEGENKNAHLKELTAKLYKKYAISRRSSGFIRTKSKKWFSLLISLLLLIIFSLVLPIVLYLQI